jgi:hypothetical protein
MAVQQLSDGNDAGVSLGQSASDLVSLHNATPTAQVAFVATNSIAALSVSGVVGFTSSAAFSNMHVLLNAIQAALIAKGIMASS